MRVKLERSGGFAGIKRTVAVDAATLPPEDAAELARLVAAADLEHYSETPTDRPGKPDRFIYRLTVEHEGGQRSVSVGEEAVSPVLRRLLDWLQARQA